MADMANVCARVHRDQGRDGQIQDCVSQSYDVKAKGNLSCLCVLPLLLVCASFRTSAQNSPSSSTQQTTLDRRFVSRSNGSTSPVQPFRSCWRACSSRKTASAALR